jgi:hypothetical protein
MCAYFNLSCLHFFCFHEQTAGGAPLSRRLLEEETTRWRFDEGEMKRRRRRIDSTTRARERHTAAYGAAARWEDDSDFGDRKWKTILGWANLG